MRQKYDHCNNKYFRVSSTWSCTSGDNCTSDEAESFSVGSDVDEDGFGRAGLGKKRISVCQHRSRSEYFGRGTSRFFVVKVVKRRAVSGAKRPGPSWIFQMIRLTIQKRAKIHYLGLGVSLGSWD